jgi:hypothetical protein
VTSVSGRPTGCNRIVVIRDSVVRARTAGNASIGTERAGFTPRGSQPAIMNEPIAKVMIIR